MSATTGKDLPEADIEQWRAAVQRSRAVDEGDAEELESHLREQIADLQKAGLSGDEAFLVAVRRLGEVDTVTAEFARVHSDRLWKQLAVPTAGETTGRPLLTMLVFAAVAVVLIQAARLLSQGDGAGAEWLGRTASLFVLPVLAAYFLRVRRAPVRVVVIAAAIVAALAVAVNLFPYQSASGMLVSIHLPVLLWFVVGVAYVGGEVSSATRRMDFIRFTGEWAIYLALIALGGAVLMGLTLAVISPIAPDATGTIVDWVLPSGVAGAVIVAAWLVEAKKSIIENLAPVLTAIFTPLFAIMLLVASVVYLVGGIGREFDRDLLTVFDVLLLVVLGLVVYGISARGARDRPGLLDVVRLVAVVSAVLLDVLVLIAMLTRIGDVGFTPNRAAAVGLNLVLLVNLVVTAWLLARLLAGRAPVLRLERWQTGYLPVFAGWLIVVVLAIPPVFGFA